MGMNEQLRRAREIGTPIDSTFHSRLAQRELKHGILPAVLLTSPESRQAQYARFEAMVGHTPLEPIPLPGGVTMWLKIESENPSESHYDRATLAVLKRLEDEGLIKPGDTILR